MSARYSQTTAKLMDALSKAQSEIVNPKKTETADVYSKRTNGKYSYRFSTLDQVIDAIKVPASNHGIAYTQPLLVCNEGVGCTTRLSCGDEFLEFDVTLPCDADIQAMGSAFTYARRYSLLAAFGIAPEEDDDGGAAMPKQNSHANGKSEQKPRPAEKAKETASDSTGAYDIQVGGKLRAEMMTDHFKSAWPQPSQVNEWVVSNKVQGFETWDQVKQCEDAKRLKALFEDICEETNNRAAKAANVRQLKDSVDHESKKPVGAA